MLIKATLAKSRQQRSPQFNNSTIFFGLQFFQYLNDLKYLHKTANKYLNGSINIVLTKYFIANTLIKIFIKMLNYSLLLLLEN